MSSRTTTISLSEPRFHFTVKGYDPDANDTVTSLVDNNRSEEATATSDGHPNPEARQGDEPCDVPVMLLYSYKHVHPYLEEVTELSTSTHGVYSYWPGHTRVGFRPIYNPGLTEKSRPGPWYKAAEEFTQKLIDELASGESIPSPPPQGIKANPGDPIPEILESVNQADISSMNQAVRTWFLNKRSKAGLDDMLTYKIVDKLEDYEKPEPSMTIERFRPKNTKNFKRYCRRFEGYTLGDFEDPIESDFRSENWRWPVVKPASSHDQYQLALKRDIDGIFAKMQKTMISLITGTSQDSDSSSVYSSGS
ncbi:uncharacterized protein L199_002099 [Kwoniella botswanensis]|uniref:uncharacterized protein n=1 Tax=Kwoniella botswanensis TaxID=1268659 RepID=UPI00315D5F80